MQKILPWLRRAVALATLAAALALCWQCIGLYLAGNAPANLDASGVHITPVYSVEKVSARLAPLSPWLLAYALLVLGTLIVQGASAPAAPRHTLTPENRLRLMKARVADLPEAARKEERLRRSTCITAGAAVGVCALFSLVYLLDGRHFTSWELEGVMGRMLLHVGPWVGIAFGVMIAASLLCARSMERELAVLKDAPKSAPAEKAAHPFPMGAVRWGILAVAVVFIVLGVMNGGLYDVLVKAINICTECIGLG